jgi:hypothetical protein
MMANPVAQSLSDERMTITSPVVSFYGVIVNYNTKQIASPALTDPFGLPLS